MKRAVSFEDGFLELSPERFGHRVASPQNLVFAAECCADPPIPAFVAARGNIVAGFR
jgi:hypothetical protein